MTGKSRPLPLASLVAALCLCLTAAAMWLRFDMDSARTHEHREHAAVDLETLIERTFHVADGRIRELTAVAQLSELSSPLRFAAFASAVVSASSPFQSLAWVAEVERDAREGAEADLAALAGRPTPLVEARSDGVTVAGVRARYFPIRGIHPLNGNQSLLGLDLAHDSAQAEALLRSLDEMQPLASAPLTLKHGEGRTGYHVFMPLRRGARPELLAAVMEPAAMLAHAVRADGFLAAQVSDVTDAGRAIVLARLGPDAGDDAVRLSRGRVLFAGRGLEVTILAAPVPLVVWSAGALWQLAAGLLLSAAFTALTWIVGGRNRKIRNLVDARTASLRDSELRMRQLFQATPEGLLIVTEDGVIEEANPQAHKLLKRSADELQGMSVEDLVPPRFRASHGDKRRSFMRSARFDEDMPMNLRGEFRVLRADGEELPVALGISPMEHGGRRKAIVVMGDLSGQVSMNARLREERDLRQRSLDALANLLLALDTSGRVTMVNRFGCEFLGQPEADLLGSSLFGRFSPTPDEAVPALKRALAALAEGQESASARISLNGSDGCPHVIDWRFSALRGDDGRVAGCMASGLDVTEELAAESTALRFGANLKATLNALPDLLIEFDESARMLEVHSGRDDLLAWPRAEMRGRLASELLPADSVAQLRRVIDDALADGFASAELTFSLPGKREQWADVSAARKVGDDDTPTCVMLLRDATERMLAQREAEHMRSVVLASGELLACINADRAVEVANPAFVRTFDCPSDMPAGQSLAGMLGASMMAKLEPALTLTFDGQVQRLPVDVGAGAGQRTLELELAPLWRGDEVRGAVLSGHDITDRAGAQRALESYRDTLEREVRDRTRALERTRAKLAHTLESSPLPIFVVNQEGQVSYWNKACTIAFGIEPEDIVGTTDAWRAFYDEPRPVMAELIVAGRSDELRRQYAGTCRASSLVHGAFEAEAHFPKLGRWLYLTAAPMLDASGKCIGAIETLQDVTTRKEAEEMTARAREAAEAAARAKSEFLANMSHEIRTPLNGVIGLAQVGVRENAGRRAHHTFDKIHRSAVHLLGLINDLLDFSKIESGRFELEDAAFEPAKVVDQALDIATPGAYDRNIAVLVSEAPNLPKALRGDGLRLTQCLVNLLGNAIKFTEEGSVRLDVDHDGHVLSLTVSDTGIGMTDEQMSRLFRPFEQADGSTTRRFGGTGLGLAITHQLVTMMGGSVAVASEIGHGSRFRLAVPLPVVEGGDGVAPALPTDLVQSGLGDEEAALLEHEFARRGCRLRSVAPGAAARAPGEFLLGTADALALAVEEGVPESRLIVVHDPGPAPRLGRMHWVRPLVVRRLATMLGSTAVEAMDDAPRRLHGMRVLGVDDNEVNRVVLADLLRLAASGEEALEIVRSLPPGALDIALLDIEMPGMDGYTLARELRRLRPEMPLIGLTAHASQSDRAKCLGAGMAEHIAKPYEIDQLVEAIRKFAKSPEKEKPMSSQIPNDAAPVPGEGDADQVNMEALLKRFRGRSEFVMRLLRTAADANQAASAKIADAVSRRDFESLRQLAHSVKGMSGNLCASAMQQRAAEVERMARARQDEVFDDAGAFAGEVDSLVSSIRRLLVD